MGFYRFLLAIGVLFNHFGGQLGHWPSRRFVSGFLISRVLDTSYRGGIDRLAAFYCNRALRIAPLYLVIFVSTILFFTLRGSTSFVRLGDGAPSG